MNTYQGSRVSTLAIGCLAGLIALICFSAAVSAMKAGPTGKALGANLSLIVALWCGVSVAFIAYGIGRFRQQTNPDQIRVTEQMFDAVTAIASIVAGLVGLFLLGKHLTSIFLGWPLHAQYFPF